MSQFVDLARGLLALEINTVVKSGMSAQKMPLPGDALIDIAQEYHVFLCERADPFGRRGGALAPWAAALSESFDWGLAPFAAPPGAAKPVERYRPSFAGDDLPGLDPKRGTTLRIFQELRSVASWIREMQDRTRAASATGDGDGAAAARIDPEDGPVLMRIQRNADQIIGILQRPELAGTCHVRTMSEDDKRMASLSSSDFVTIRKAWEVGTEVVVMQTSIQIDGDVVTRVQPDRVTATSDTLIGIHREAVGVSFRYWSFLIDTLGRFAGKTVGALVGGSG